MTVDRGWNTCPLVCLENGDGFNFLITLTSGDGVICHFYAALYIVQNAPSDSCFRRQI